MNFLKGLSRRRRNVPSQSAMQRIPGYIGVLASSWSPWILRGSDDPFSLGALLLDKLLANEYTRAMYGKVHSLQNHPALPLTWCWFKTIDSTLDTLRVNFPWLIFLLTLFGSTACWWVLIQFFCLWRFS